MKPFDLEEALDDKAVITRSGLSAEIFVDSGGSILAVVRQKSGNKFCFLSTSNGNFYDDEKESDFDLFMASEKRTIWLTVYPNEPNDKHGYISAGFVSELLAKRHARENALVVAFPVEVEI